LLQGDPLPVKVRNLTSDKTEDSYFYYYLPYCLPRNVLDHVNQSAIVRKDLIKSSPYEFKMLEPQMCNVVCRTTLSSKDAKEFKEKIDFGYRVNMILDDHPLFNPYNRSRRCSLGYHRGFPVGMKILSAEKMEHKYFINNHLTFTIKYYKDEKTDAARVVRFEVKPLSVKHKYEGEWSDKLNLTNCDSLAKYSGTGNDSLQDVEDEKEIIFTYDVEFQESEITWDSGWDSLFCSVDSHNIHWASIFHSALLSFIFTTILLWCMEPKINSDISKFDAWETQEEGAAATEEENEWIVRGDAFRPPANSDLLCVFAGTGVQCFGMVLVTMVSAALGFISPSNRTGLMTKLLFLWVFMGIFAGYVSASLYKRFKATRWKKITLMTSFPGIVFIILFILSAPSWEEESWGAVPFGNMFALVLLWLGIFVSLVSVGSYVGFEKPAIKDLPSANRIPREIPKQSWFMNPVFTILIGGMFPFGVVSVELFFIITSKWLDQFYCILGFLFLVFIFLVIICAQMTIIFCYNQLRGEDYLWWWRSFLNSGSSGLYLFLYVAFYFTKMNGAKPVSGVLYFGYLLIASFTFFLLTGTVGFFACFLFTRHLYSSLKID
ncbi:transmembrane 9 superfamily member 4, partial [Dorcoceras hygrometricum]